MKLQKKRKVIREHAAAEERKRDEAARLAKEKKHVEWLQTKFPAKHAAKMSEAVEAMDATTVRHHRAVMTAMQSRGVFNRETTVPDLWDPNHSMLHNFGSLPDIVSKVGHASRRIVRISPHLEVFIKHRTAYKAPAGGPDPTNALQSLLRACFVAEERLFQGEWSHYNLLVTSKLVIDLAFMRAVKAASNWLGPSSMPAGFISEWPPNEDDAGL